MGKYVIVTPFFPSADNWRGAFVLDQANALRRAGMDIEVFMPSKSKRASDFSFRGFTVHRFYVRETPTYFFNGFFNDYNSRSFLNAVSAIGLSISDVDFVHCHTGSFGIYGVALKRLNPAIKTLLQHHDPDPFQVRNGRLADWKPNLLYRARNSYKIFSSVDYHICISEEVKQNLLRFPSCSDNEDFEPYKSRLGKLVGFTPLAGLNCVTLFNGVDTDIFKPLPHSRSGYVIGCVGNFIDWKRQCDLIEAVSLIRDSIDALRVIFVGSGPELDSCRRLVEKLDLRDVVEFRSEVVHEELARFYQSLDLFVLPSVFEGFGCVYLEAAACGVPFICCRNQGASEYILPEEADRWLAPKRDPRSLARMILRQYRERAHQSLAHPIDINTLVSRFINEISASYTEP